MAENPSPSCPPLPKKKRSGWLIVVGLVSTVMLLALVFVVARHAVLASRVTIELQKVRAAGYPTNAQEWNDFYRTPENDCTSLWLDAVGNDQRGPFESELFYEASRELPIVGTGTGPIPPPGKTWQELEAAKQLLTQFDQSMKKMHEAARLGGAARFPLDSQLGFEMKLQHIDSLRVGARMLTLEAHVCAHEQNSVGVVDAIHALFMMAKSLESEPLFVSSIVRVKILNSAVELVNDFLPIMDFQVDDLKRLKDALRASEKPDFLTNVLAGERAIGIITFQNPVLIKRLFDGPIEQVLGTETPTVLFKSDEDLLAFLEHYDAIILASKKGFPTALGSVMLEGEQIRKKVDSSSLSRTAHPFTRFMIVGDADQTLFKLNAKTLAVCRSSETALGCELFRRQHKHWPKTLDELVPEFLSAVPLDPFDGKPLRYKPDGAGFVIYSIGKDRVDNGGVEQPDANNEIIFRRPLDLSAD